MKPVQPLMVLLAGLLLSGAGLAAPATDRFAAPNLDYWGSSRVTGTEAEYRYGLGLKHKERAWRLEERALEEDTEKRRDKRLARAQREYKKAIREYERAVLRNPSMYQAFNELGFALRKTGDFENAIRAYNSALRLNPDFAQAIAYRAEAFLALGLIEETKEAYMQLSRLDREKADKLMSEMQAWIQQQRANADTEGLSEFEQER